MECPIILSIIFLINISQIFAIYEINNKTTNSDKPEVWTERGIFGPLLEEWALTANGLDHRQRRVMKLPPIKDGYVISKVDNVVEINTEGSTKIMETRPPGKIVTRPPLPSTQNKPPPNNGGFSPMIPSGGREVSETDLYLLGAIEKLVFRVDYMEKRLRKVEEKLHYMTAGNRVDDEPCPENFTRAGEGCYHFGDRKLDWQTASQFCRRFKATLVELETTAENRQLIAHIHANLNLQTKDYWTGGLNPGLLWIWSNSARPVVTNRSTKANDIRGSGRCLGLVFDSTIRTYVYWGQDCARKQFYICEHEEKRPSNEISREE